MKSSPHFKSVWGFLGVVLALSACSETNSGKATTAPACTTLTGDSWVPKVTGAAATNHSSAITVTKTEVLTTGFLTGRGQPAPATREVSVSIPMLDDLGPLGSISLVAEVTGFPEDLEGGAYPLLVSLNDGVNELINLTRAGTGDDCAQKGYEICGTSTCSNNPSCTITWPSAYQNRTQWEDHQYANFGYTSVNTFPTCNWSGGSSSTPTTNPACAFNTAFSASSGFFTSGKLRSGTTYTAKYLLVASQYASFDTNRSVGLKVEVIKKANSSSTVGGAIDLNIVLVGNKNIQASRTAAGKRNLDSLMSAVYDQYSQSSVNVKLGKINVVEWTCENDGDSNADIGVLSLGSLFSSGSSLLPAGTEGKALNIYMVSKIENDIGGSATGQTVLGLSGAIGGPMINGQETSGLAFASFDKLATFNPGCTDESCPVTHQEADFVDMSTTIAHEMGHFLGLNHPSESAGTQHDALADTPICTARESVGSSSFITIGSCLKSDVNPYNGTGKTCSQACPSYSSTNGLFCPEALECQFNHTMWWTAKNFNEKVGSGDGNLFSTDSGLLINYNPFIQ